MTDDDVEAYLRHLRETERRHRPADPRRRLARQIESAIAHRLMEAGHLVNPTSHASRFDLLVDDCLQVEVKAATWRSHARGGRYQFNYHNAADILIACCVNLAVHHYVIPTAELGDRSYLAITSPDPGQYTGQWATYLGAWDLIDRAIERARQETHQPALITEPAGII